MFSLLTRKRTDALPLLSSKLFDEKGFYGSFINDLKNCSESVLIESPYLTIKRVSYLAPLLKRLRRRGVSVRINTREPSHHTKSLQYEAVEAIKILKKSGVKVYVCSDLRHRKLAIIDHEVLWEGSLNIMSQSSSREVMRRTVSSDMCQQMVRFTRVNRLFW